LGFRLLDFFSLSWFTPPFRLGLVWLNVYGSELYIEHLPNFLKKKELPHLLHFKLIFMNSSIQSERFKW
jgi:hypothetical protein